MCPMSLFLLCQFVGVSEKSMNYRLVTIDIVAVARNKSTYGYCKTDTCCGVVFAILLHPDLSAALDSCDRFKKYKQARVFLFPLL